MGYKNRNDWPLGFRSALENNPAAMREFEDFPELRQAEILERAYTISSPFEMQFLINTWTPGEYGIPNSEIL